MARFEYTFALRIEKGGTNHHERTAGHQNTHTSEEGAFQPLHYITKGRDFKA